MLLILPVDRQTNDEIHVIILLRRKCTSRTRQGSTVFADKPTFGAFVGQYIALFGVWLGEDGLHHTTAVTRPVTRQHVHMERTQAMWAMIAAGLA